MNVGMLIKETEEGSKICFLDSNFRTSPLDDDPDNTRYSVQ